MMTQALHRCLTTQIYELTGAEVREWRAAQPGTYKARNGEERQGWSQVTAAAWMGVTDRTWQYWEGGRHMPQSRVRRLVEYSQSLMRKLDQILEP